jgi:agmatine/peptidylarginine deiminase
VSNGSGLCAITRTSLIDADLPGPNADTLELFLASLGCHATAVLPGIPEETTGHADVVVQFLAANLAMVAWVDPEEAGELSRDLDQAAEHLATAAELGDYELQIVRIPIVVVGETFYSYVNLARLRSRILVPRFNNIAEEIEQSAYATLEAAVPGVSLVPIDADTMIQLGGAVHCVTLGLGPSRPYPKLTPPYRVPERATRRQRRG